jgi:uncharacterized protein YecT (DUF1311 family)
VFIPLFIEALGGRASTFDDGYVTGKEIGTWIEQILPTIYQFQTPHSDVIRDPKLIFGDMVFQFNTPSSDVARPSAPAAITSVSPSFDCEKATWKSEKMVCESSELSRLDRLMNDMYHDAVARSPDKALQFKNEQNHWLRKDRESCADDDCLKQIYKQRVEELRKQ